MNSANRNRLIWRIVLIVLTLGLCVGAGVKVVGKAEEKKTAFVRWMGDTERLANGEMIYGTDPEGYPNLPMAALFLTPFHSLGVMGGSIAWLLLKSAMIAFILWTVWRVTREGPTELPGWFMPLLLLLSARVFVGDLTHGNINLVVGGLVAAALVCSHTKHEFLAGFVIGLAAVLKVTPMLFVIYFLYKRRWLSVLGAGVGVVIFLFVVPGFALGFTRNLELIGAWHAQMIAPFMSGSGVGYMQTRYDNQSLAGLMYRLFTESLAIPVDVKRGFDAVSVNVTAWDQAVVARLLKAAYLGIVALTAWLARPTRGNGRQAGNLGEFALVFLAMLFISERSWKHHYVLLILGHAFVLRHLLVSGKAWLGRRTVIGLLAGSLACHWCFGSGTLGHRSSDLAEAYGVYLLGGLLLYAAVAVILVIQKRDAGCGMRDRAEGATSADH